MGVPAFYRWLSLRYPKIVVDVVEEEPELVGALEIPVDITQPNPNGIELDNLYLDMNGIIHPCFHPEDKPAPATESEVFANIFDYIDRLVAMVRPRKVLYMAIDGVAPRAKMNQQRSRRFRAAQDREEQKKEEAKLRAEFLQQGIQIPEKEDGDTFDSNIITPGTEFMDRLAMALQWYVHKRLNEERGWKDLIVVLSDSNTPGEGEHKFMQFIREQRARPDWNPNTRHCVYGLDADLIMLALASHEPHFYILREVVFQVQDQAKKRAMEMYGNAMGQGQGGAESEKKPEVAKKPFQFLRIDMLRDYLALEYSDLHLPFPFDPERVIDDFVFMCFFVGNDFLPHMPTLDIREKGLELMIKVYRDVLPKMQGYMSSGSHLNLDRIEHFICAVGAYEDQIFQARMRKMRADKNRFLQRKAEQQQHKRFDDEKPKAKPNYTNPLSFVSGPIKVGKDNITPSHPCKPAPVLLAPGEASNRSAAAALRAKLKRKHAGLAESEEHKAVGVLAPDAEDAKRAKADADSQAEALWAELASKGEENAADVKAEDTVPQASAEEIAEAKEELKSKLKDTMKTKSDMFEDMVKSEEGLRLDQEGWKARYYTEKFGVSDPAEQQQLIRDLVKAYVEGLCWVMKYYYDGVASWRWYYPFHYAPFASDLAGIAGLKIEFNLGEPFQPLNQLMGVLPAASAHALPSSLRPLFTDENSPILDFYPNEFVVDMNGKRFAWQGVALLPFIDEKRLLDATGPVIDALPAEQKRRNERRLSLVLARADSACGQRILLQAREVRERGVPPEEYAEQASELPAGETGGVSGQLVPCAGDACPVTIPAPPFKGLGKPISDNQVAMAMYMDPPHQRHEPRILPGTDVPPSEVSVSDLPKEEPLWCQAHELRRQQREMERQMGGGRGLGPAGHRMVRHGVGAPMGAGPRGAPLVPRHGSIHPRAGPPPQHARPGGVMAYAPQPQAAWGGPVPPQPYGQPQPVYAQPLMGVYQPPMQPPAMLVGGIGGMGYVAPAPVPMQAAGRGGGSYFAAMRPQGAQGYQAGGPPMQFGGPPPGRGGPRPPQQYQPYGGNRFQAFRDPRSQRLSFDEGPANSNMPDPVSTAGYALGTFGLTAVVFVAVSFAEVRSKVNRQLAEGQKPYQLQAQQKTAAPAAEKRVKGKAVKAKRPKAPSAPTVPGFRSASASKKKK